MRQRTLSRHAQHPVDGVASRASYLAHAEACLKAATGATDPALRALHEEECQLWLMLARQRQAIEDVLQQHLEAA